LLPLLGYERAGEVARIAMTSGQPIRDIVIENNWLTAAQFDELVSPEAVCRLGMPDVRAGDSSNRAGGGQP
jgi:aspartate ammonia-lyase